MKQKENNFFKSRQSVHQSVLSFRLIQCTVDPINKLKSKLRNIKSEGSVKTN